MATKKFDTIRNEVMTEVAKALNTMGYDTLTTASNEVTVPIVNGEGDEGYIVLVFKVPSGSHDGEAYDGYAIAEDYKRKVAEKAEKAEQAKAKKAEKAKADAEKRAKAKAEKEKGE